MDRRDPDRAALGPSPSWLPFQEDTAQKCRADVPWGSLWHAGVWTVCYSEAGTPKLCDYAHPHSSDPACTTVERHHPPARLQWSHSNGGTVVTLGPLTQPPKEC